jgi:2'-5' RNA ligase
MARQQPARLAYKSSLALLPPPSITAPIEAVRRVHDKHFARWPPHINLIYPFLAAPSQPTSEGSASSKHLREDIRSRIRKAVEPIEPFQVALYADASGVFSHRKKTVWMSPSTDRVEQLQAALQAEFAECDAGPNPFTPHLSIGQAQTDTAAQELRDEIKRSIANFSKSTDGSAPVALDWNIDNVYVLERKGYHDRFEVVGSIELGAK